jgi:hypothetical protein
MLTIFKAYKKVLEFADLRDSNNNIILAYYYKSKMLAKELLRSIERRKVLIPLRNKRLSSLTIKIYKKRSVSISLRARNYTLSSRLQNLSFRYRAI